MNYENKELKFNKTHLGGLSRSLTIQTIRTTNVAVHNNRGVLEGRRV
jgi:hypothetical protein